MKLAWHIALKDLRRLRVPIALWGLLIAAKLGVGVMLIYGTGSDFDSMRWASYGPFWLELFVAYLLVAALAHADKSVGTTAFWMTRPVSGGKVLAAKLMGFAIVFGLIPLLITIPWW